MRICVSYVCVYFTTIGISMHGTGNVTLLLSYILETTIKSIITQTIHSAFCLAAIAAILFSY